MWISKQIIKEQKVPAVECGKVTMSSNGAVEATSTGVERIFEHFRNFIISLPTRKRRKIYISLP